LAFGASTKSSEEKTWIPWYFTAVPHAFWDDILNQRRYLDWYADQQGIESMEQVPFN
jgi:hypothetical protein